MNQRNFAVLLSALALVAEGACARTADAPMAELLETDAAAPVLTQATDDAGVDAATAPPVDAAPAHDTSVSVADAGATPDDDGSAQTSDDAGEASPDGGSECVAGTYKGAFSGQVSFLPAVLSNIVAVDISGTITITVETDSTGNLLTVRNGRIEGTDQDGKPVTAVVNGVLDCSTKQLKNGTLTNGVYERSTILPVNFTGTVTADYNPNPPSATGKWKTSGGFLEGGGGTWSAVLVP